MHRAIQGRGPGPYFQTTLTEAQSAKNIFFGDQAPPYLRVWMAGAPLM